MKINWIVFIAKRYFRNKRKDKGLTPSILSVVGITVGVMALISVLGVMNGFQLGYIEDILEIKSYHIRITAPQGILNTATLNNIRNLKDVKAVLQFRDIQTMVKGQFSEFKACVLRGIPEDADKTDPDLLKQLNIVRGNFDLENKESIIIGNELAYILGLTIGDFISVVSMTGESFGVLTPKTVDYTITGIFNSGYYDYDTSLGFINLDSAAMISSEEDLIYGIKLKNRFKDKKMLLQIKEILKEYNLQVVSWRDYNSSFFGALRMEKIIMMFIIGLIFIVVGVNIYNSQRRGVYERQEEIGIMKCIGASPGSVQSVFVLDGIFIGFTGGIIGLLLGLLLAENINAVFSIAQNTLNIFLLILNKILSPVFKYKGFDIVLFSKESFYLSEVPCRVLFHEAFLIFLLAPVSSVLAAFFASRKISEIKPSEVLRYE